MDASLNISNMPTVLVLAAGRGERYLASGGKTHKLAALLEGKTILQRTLDAVSASGLPYHVVSPCEDQALGMGDSIARGVRETPSAFGWLIIPADLPLLKPSTILEVAQCLISNYLNVSIVQAHYQATAGHPVGFTRQHVTQLLSLNGDEGARHIVQNSRIAGKYLALAVDDIGVIQDIDTLDDLLTLKTYLASQVVATS